MVEKMLISLLKTCELKKVNLCKNWMSLKKYTDFLGFARNFKRVLKIVLHAGDGDFVSVRGGF